MMCLAFALEGLAMTLWLVTRGDPLLFVLLSGLVCFSAAGARYLLAVSLDLDRARSVYAQRDARNVMWCLYIAQGIGAIFGGPLASLLHEATGNWVSVFAVAIAADLITASLAIAVMKPIRARYLRGR